MVTSILILYPWRWREEPGRFLSVIFRKSRRHRLCSLPVAGDTGTASLRMMLVNMLEGRFISEHDAEIGRRIERLLADLH